MTAESASSTEEITAAFLWLVESFANPAGRRSVSASATRLLTLAAVRALGGPMGTPVAVAVTADALDMMEEAGVADTDSLFAAAFADPDEAWGDALPAEAMWRLLRLARFVRHGIPPIETIPTDVPWAFNGLAWIAARAVAAPLDDPAKIPEAFDAFAERNLPVPAVQPVSVTLHYGEDVDVGAAAQSLVAPPGRNDPCWCGSGTKFKLCHDSLSPAECGNHIGTAWFAGCLPVTGLVVVDLPAEELSGAGRGDIGAGTPFLLVDKRTDPSLEEIFRRVTAAEDCPGGLDAVDGGFYAGVTWWVGLGSARLHLKWDAPFSHEMTMLVNFTEETLLWFEQIYRVGFVCVAATGPEGFSTGEDMAGWAWVGVAVDRSGYAAVLEAARDHVRAVR